jgi:spermidine/putrescine-binding protein
MYNTAAGNEDLPSLLENEGWGALVDHTDRYEVGMYDSSRDAVAAALLYLGYSVNSEVESELAAAEAVLVEADFAWGEDLLRSSVIQNSLDMALVYSGDYFSEYFLALEDGTDVNFAFFVPETTNVWMDAFVVAKTSEQTDLAYEFMNYLLETEVGLQNYDYIGYAPCYQEFYDEMVTNPEFGYDLPHFDPFPEGTLREMYVYGTDERSQRIVAILNSAKDQD